MNSKENPSLSERVDPPAVEEDEATRPVSLRLIARLAAQDPTVQLKVGVLEWASDLQIGEEDKKPSGS